MKKKSSILGRIVAPALLAATCFLAAPAHAQTSSTTLGSCLSNLVTCGTVTTNVVNAREVNIRQGRGLLLETVLCGTQSTNTGNLVLLFALSRDGTNYSTTTPVVVTAVANGSTGVRSVTNIPPAALDNARKLKLITITNQLVNMGSITVSNVFTGVGN